MKEAEILKLENNLRNLDSEWKHKYTQLEQSNSTFSHKNKYTIEEKERVIAELERQKRSLKKTVTELEGKVVSL